MKLRRSSWIVMSTAIAVACGRGSDRPPPSRPTASIELKGFKSGGDQRWVEFTFMKSAKDYGLAPAYQVLTRFRRIGIAPSSHSGDLGLEMESIDASGRLVRSFQFLQDGKFCVDFLIAKEVRRDKESVGLATAPLKGDAPVIPAPNAGSLASFEVTLSDAAVRDAIESIPARENETHQLIDR